MQASAQEPACIPTIRLAGITAQDRDPPGVIRLLVATQSATQKTTRSASLPTEVKDGLTWFAL